MPDYIAPHPLYVTADRARVVPEGSPEADSLLVGPGGRIPVALAQYYGLDGGEIVPSAIEEDAAARERIRVEKALRGLPPKPGS